jgi:hypothetical protein
VSVIDTINRTEVSQLGTERSSMEALILTCLQAQLIAGRVNKQSIPKQVKIELISELKLISPKECKIDAKVD